MVNFAASVLVTKTNAVVATYTGAAPLGSTVRQKKNAGRGGDHKVATLL